MSVQLRAQVSRIAACARTSLKALLFKRRSGAGLGVGGQGSVKADQGLRCRSTHGFMLLPFRGLKNSSSSGPGRTAPRLPM
jgi:hypothetical protein